MEMADDDDWCTATMAVLVVPSILEELLKNMLEIAVQRDPFVRKEGAGVWNCSRAPHCYGYEYERHFGRPLSLLNCTKTHEAAWRQSSWWPNVPPIDHFYADHFSFERQCISELEERAKAQYEKELRERKKRRRAWEVSYNKVRRKRRKERKKQTTTTAAAALGFLLPLTGK